MVKTLPFNAEGTSLIPGQGTKTPHFMWHGQKFIRILIIKEVLFSLWKKKNKTP